MVRYSRMLGAILVVGVLSALAAGCSSESRVLDGTNWQLSEWTLSSLDPADLAITAQFADGQISGSGGVNSYSGPYELGPASAFSVGTLATTMMGGPEPAMRGEAAYLTLLGQARSYKLTADRLTLYDAGANESLIFKKASR
jgi:heat shock protein HslJ